MRPLGLPEQGKKAAVERNRAKYLSCSKERCYFAPAKQKIIVMSLEERKSQMAKNRAINSKKPARSAFMRWARAHKGAFIINDPEMKAQYAMCSE